MSTYRILVLRALGLGDLLTAVPALRALRRAHRSAHITLAGPVALAALLPAGLVDEVRDARSLAPLDADLAGADLAVNLHGRGPQSTTVLDDIRPHRLLAFGRTSTWRADEHEVHRWCRLLSESGFPADPCQLDLDVPDDPPLARGALLVHPGAAQLSRRWPVERWAQVARRLQGSGRVLVTGSTQERPLARQVVAAAGLPSAACVAGATDVRGLAALIGCARLLVSADTGVAHLATALRTPSVVLFGPTSPQLWGPPPERMQHQVLWAGRAGDNFAGRVDPGLLELTVDQVVDSVDALLSHPARIPEPMPR
ncbi:MAG: glycosyltransferase family 9 protein [Actinobacteria bacterium]|nr:glycosyltransferase family 9 protein [Actinomycetota bacterium]MBW3646275.1 glycosyltransferase family 9 protein [Actinomycetota bacterium]